MMKSVLLAALALIGAQADFDWRREPSRLMIHGAISNWSQACSREFGFTRIAEQPPAVMEGRVEAHLLLAGYSADTEVLDWSRLITSWRNHDASEERGADALLAALADPNAYARAEDLWVNSAIGALRTFFEGCQRGVRNDFIRSNYLTGEGAIPDTVEPRIRQRFRESVEQLRREERQ